MPDNDWTVLHGTPSTFWSEKRSKPDLIIQIEEKVDIFSRQGRQVNANMGSVTYYNGSGEVMGGMSGLSSSEIDFLSRKK